MRYFLDLEFWTQPSDPEASFATVSLQMISIGLVREDDEFYYAVNTDHDSATAMRTIPWLTDNVYKNLALDPDAEIMWRKHKDIRDDVLDFVGNDHDPEFWGYFGDYDWVVFCDLFGPMIDLPDHFPKYLRDLKQLAWHLGLDKRYFPKHSGTAHNALADARWNKSLYEMLSTNMPSRLVQNKPDTQ